MKELFYHDDYRERNTKKITHPMSLAKKPSKKYNVLYGNYCFQNENTITTNNEVYWLYNMVARHTAPFCK